MKKHQKNRKPYRKLITKENLQDALDVALADIETINYNDDTSFDDLETVDFNKNDNIEVILTVQRVVISDDNDDNEIEFLKETPLYPRDRLKHSEKKYLQILPKKN